MSELPTPSDATEDAAHTPTGADYVSDRRFVDFPISAEVLKGVLDLGYSSATPVQAATIDPALAGKDMVVRAKTGTGKTTAFSVPIIERAIPGLRKPQALILAPVRELAQQIADEIGTIATYKDLAVATLVGGLPMGPQEKALEEGAEILVGTPGRVLDHARRKNLDLSSVTMLCLDEADEMLSMGFFEDVSKLIDACASDRQILLFSATVSPDTERLISRYTRDALSIRLSSDADNVELLTHVLYETTPGLHKVRALLHLLDVEDPASAIIFCNTREDTNTVATFLDRQGLDAQLLSGELSQSRRSQVMAMVKAGAVRFLVSTDVAARGIDISDLTHVVNYSLPHEAAVYLHRAGRTGRIGKQGTVISLVGGTDLATRRTLEGQHQLKFEKRELPDNETCTRSRVDRQARQIRDAMGLLVFESYLPTVRELKERPDGDALLAAALRGFFQWDRERKAASADVSLFSDVQEGLREARDRKDEARKRKDGSSSRGRSSEGRSSRGRSSDSRSGDREERRERPARPSKADVDDLDALLVAGPVPEDMLEVSGDDSADDDAKKKKRRRRKKRPGESESGSAEAAPTYANDDLDALLGLD